MADAVRWPARLALSATRDGEATRVHARHDGPLRLLKTLYPEGRGVAHAVLVHPPGGLVGGDRLDIDIDVQPGAHLLVTTPAATRFYRSTAGAATQAVQARVATGARLEWLPQETLAYPACDARNEVRLTLAEGASLFATEVLGLGLPAAGEPFDRGRLLQHLEVTGQWLDRGWLDAADRALLDGPCGLAGHGVLGTLVYAQTEALSMAPLLLDEARELLDAVPRSGVTHLQSPGGALLLARVVGDDVESVTLALRRVRALWRDRLWQLSAADPRIWAT
ncbi:urease accessory protein UreD [Roseateles puraquae]|uniref:Urease accessory protein UreD n=1 Tax=Roseateles puraquae TaxID=431059 RepID=A0A254N7C0_9BURK|nr:urease accessory protein UreD [Roseateles puraquae]MDG0854538.1 urease accessory protein UreD [Roseateles puraquae]OWR03899.1 urease accessory protein [Roseateles puraquae]